jgi:hypothetical protein
MLINLRSMSEKNVITDLISKVHPQKFTYIVLILIVLSHFLQISPENFQTAFGAPIEQASELLAAKTLSISKLMVLMPPGTVDPTPHIYDSTMYALGGLMTVAFVSHAMVRPLAAKVVTIDVQEAVTAPVETPVIKAAETEKDAYSGDRRVN